MLLLVFVVFFLCSNGSLIKDTFQTSMMMSTYLLAFFVCDFKFLSYNFTEYGVQVNYIKIVQGTFQSVSCK